MQSDFVNRANTEYIDQLYQRYQTDPRSIDPQYACCTFRGSVTALRVSDGGSVWKSYLVGPPVKTGVTSTRTLRQR